MDIIKRKPSEKDVEEAIKILALTTNNGESFDRDLYLNELILKPWGCEYRIYCDCIFDIWRLHISPNQSTSMHCHIQKDTVLFCLFGDGFTRFLDGSIHHLKAGENIYIGKGVFHATSSGSAGLELIEVENPRNKFDLLRSKDNYGRESTAYEVTHSDHDILQPFLNIGPSSYIRNFDLHGKFKFSKVILSREVVLDESLIFIILIGVKHHLSGKISIVKKRDLIIDNHPNEQAILISYI